MLFKKKNLFSIPSLCRQVFVWIGNEAQEEEKAEAMTSGESRLTGLAGF